MKLKSIYVEDVGWIHNESLYCNSMEEQTFNGNAVVRCECNNETVLYNENYIIVKKYEKVE